MANDRKFPNKNPIAVNCRAKNITNMDKSGFIPDENIRTYKRDIMEKQTAAVKAIRLIPKRITNVL